MKPISCIIGVSILISNISCSTSDSIKTYNQPVEWVLDKGLCEPETIIHDTQTNQLIVSNICGFKRNGEGYLSILNMDGTLKTTRWIDGFNAPAGMAILGRSLYVTDLDRVQLINIDTGKVTDKLGPFSDAKAFNDLAVDSDGTVYVSDSARHKVIKIKGGVAAAYPNDEASFPFANGLHLDRNTLYVGSDKIYSIDLKTSKINNIRHDGLSDIDGIEPDGRGGLTVSIVGGDVWHLPKSGQPEIWTAANLSSTNHAYLPDANLVLVPTGYDNTIIAFQAK
ncbi:MAG: hypothetical protein HKO02_12590 [Hyphomonadaceae bacterium]|nr:hypothetical protein [Hyphomonadaceae bacterium]